MAKTGVVSVFGPQFCTSLPVDLTIFGTKGTFTVSDTNTHTVKFRVTKIKSNEMRALSDAAGNPIATLREKYWSFHRRWEVFRGDSKKKKDKLFSVRTPSIFKFRLKYHVFLASNRAEKVCDFKVKGKWKKKSLCICAGRQSSTILSRVCNKNPKAKSYDELGVAVEANTDQAFVVAVIMILDAIYERDLSAKDNGAGKAETVANLLTACAGFSF